MINNKSILAPVCVLLMAYCNAQDFPRREYSLERLADEIFPLQDDDLNYEELYENLAQIMANPIDLNRATIEELRSLFILKEAQLQELMQHREENGLFLSVYELQSLPSFDNATLYKLIPFVQVKDDSGNMGKSLLKRIVTEQNNYFVMRYERTLENREGYLLGNDSVPSYAGSPDKFYLRFRISHAGDFSVGFTLEKDPGETLSLDLKNKKAVFDYHSFHLQALNKGRIKNLIIGDYMAQFGQGLTLGGSFGMGKGSETISTIRRSNLGFLPYTSLNESGFFRGAALTYRLSPSFFVHGFGSHLYRDGNLALDNLSESFASSFITSGFHRTANEIADRKSVGETNYGSVLSFKKKSVDAGVIFHQTFFSIPIYRNPTLYNQFYFSGNQNTNIGAYFNYTLNNFTFFSEATQTIHHGRGIIIGTLGSLTPKFEVSLLYRKYDRDFQSLYSNAIAENSSPQNESGMYWGWKYSFNKKYSLSGYVDLFKFSWLRYRGYAPSNGSEWLLRFNYQPSKPVLIFLQIREENKVRNMSNESVIYQTAIGRKRNYWINLDYAANKRWSFKTRAQFSSYHIANTTKGFVLMQDVKLDLGKLSVAGRYALFDTDDYDNRQYVYENDVWLAFSFPAYYGKGIREYLLLQYKLSRKIDLWLRWAHTRFLDQEVIGSGSEQIEGNTRNDIKFQARIRL